MARKTREVVIDELNALGVPVIPDAKYDDLCRLLKQYSDPNEEGNQPSPTGPEPLKIVNRLKKRNTFLADAVRDERDAEFLNKEIGQRKYKGQLLRVTRIKEYVVSDDGYWETKFIIDLKE